jgi:hypothetical protein
MYNAINPIFLQTDYAAIIKQLEITSSYLNAISDIGEMIPEGGALLKLFAGLGTLLLDMSSPSPTELLLDYLDEQFKIINEKLDAIYSKISDMETLLTQYYNELSSEILNSQIVITAISNINRMAVYLTEANNLVIDLKDCLSETVIDWPQIRLICEQRPQHYLNIINQYAHNPILDNTVGAGYNLFYNIMIINNFADFPTLALWHQKLFALSFNLVYYGQVCNRAMNLSQVFQNQSLVHMTNTLTSIATGFANQFSELNYNQFVGCFVDSEVSRDLPAMHYNSSANMSVEFCVGYCQQFGYLYAGVQQG